MNLTCSQSSISSPYQWTLKHPSISLLWTHVAVTHKWNAAVSMYLFSTHCFFMLIQWRVLPSGVFAALPCTAFLQRVPPWAYISLISQNTFCWATRIGRRDDNDPAVDSKSQASDGGTAKEGLNDEFRGNVCNLMRFSYSEHIFSASLSSFNHSRKPLLL